MKRPGARRKAREAEFRAELAELQRIRKFVEEESRRLGLSEERVFDLRLVVSEACANAVEHSEHRGDIRVAIARNDGKVEVEIVHGGNIRPPQARPERLHRGLGLPLMASLADQLTITNLVEGGTSIRVGMCLA